MSYLPRNLPDSLNILIDLATDLRWTWSHAGDAVWEAIEPIAWEQTNNPYVILQNLPQQRLQMLAQDADFRKKLQHLATTHADYYSSPTWYGTNYPGAELSRIAYFSMEFGLGNALPLYAGGLGILAGDYLKTASDLGVPVVGVGLLYQEGYFRQVIDGAGHQLAIYPYNDPLNLPIQPCTDASGAWLKISLDFPGRQVWFRVWQARVGRVWLYLLDSNDPMNSPSDRGITGQLYGGGQEVRLMQEIALGVGGWRLLDALGLQIDVCHLNEGHAALVTLERARRCMAVHALDFWEALWATRAGNVFTTHTPVASGFDVFAPELLVKYGTAYADRLGVAPEELLGLGRRDPQAAGEPFNMAYLAARTCGAINGVSRLHGEVSRQIFQPLYPRWPEREVPVSHVTNGVHVPSWDSPAADAAWTQAAGKERWRGDVTGVAESILKNVSDEALWAFRGQERADLVAYARKCLARQLGQRGAAPTSAAQALEALDPNVFTLGFARRFAEYKRPNLLLHDPERLVRLLTNSRYPVQLIVAGKAHPGDALGQRFIEAWVRFIQHPQVRLQAVFLEDYDMELAQELVQGVDVWLNTPRRPWEACGTSGMKVLVNGGLNLSTLDGWWAEAYAPELGWALGDGQVHGEPDGDAAESRQLYRLLENDIVPMFYQRDVTGIPRAWIARMRTSMARLAPRFSSNRMLHDYLEQMYLPAASALRQRRGDGNPIAKTLRRWELELRQHWHEIHWGHVRVHREGAGWSFEVQVYLGEILADDVALQLIADPLGRDAAVCQDILRQSEIAGAVNGYCYRGWIETQRAATEFTPRLVPHHPQARVPTELNLILWHPGPPYTMTGSDDLT